MLWMFAKAYLVWIRRCKIAFENKYNRLTYQSLIRATIIKKSFTPMSFRLALVSREGE